MRAHEMLDMRAEAWALPDSDIIFAYSATSLVLFRTEASYTFTLI